ncbi:MAG: O-antigen ligase family protein [Clostridia bacterium]|nr:O-antigen ligase family protein [Clostridia bacterium]
MKNIAKMNKVNIMPSALMVFLFASILAIGLFHEWTSCVASVLLTVWLFFNVIRDKKLTFNINLTLISVVFIVLMYGISAFWALDRGMAVIGFFKFLPVLLFTFCLYLKEDTESLIKRYIPIFMGIVVIVFAALMQIPALKDYFSVAGRFSGTFQYPNSFAIVVLAAQLLAFSAPVKKYIKTVLIAVLLFGIFYTGSRTVLVLALLSNAAMLIYRIRFSKKTALISSAVFAVVLGVSLTLAFLRISPFDRILTINFGASTFIGRLLYFKDALPVIFKHPFGIGYLGYFYSQTSFQTGIYSVKYIHNDILQLALDIGWLPPLVFVLAVLKSIFSKGVKPENRIILSVMLLHSLFDFDLQFIAVFMLLIVFMKRDGGKQITIKKTGVLFIAAVLSL